MLIALVAVSGLAAVLVLVLLAPYRRANGDARASRWLINPGDVNAASPWILGISSLLTLFLELLLIRWISSEVRIFAYFKNFVLIACFLGFGIGCYLARKPISFAAQIVPLLWFVLLLQTPWKAVSSLIGILPVLLAGTTQVQIWGVGWTPPTGNALVGLLLGVLFVLPTFALIATTFIPLGQMVGWALENARSGIAAYSINVFASIVGIALYTALAFADQPPHVWFAVAGVLAVAMVWPLPRLRFAFGAMTIAVMLMLAVPNGRDEVVRWSPYQKLVLTPLRDGRETVGYTLLANQSWYQKAIDLRPSFVAMHRRLFAGPPFAWNVFDLPYRFVTAPGSVLVLGSGMGNDIAAAIRNRAANIVAVEIDPLIVKFGKTLHPERPYDSPRVRLIVDDARSYIQNSRAHFDLIVFSALDSHTAASQFTNIRIDNYVYTREAFEATKRLLANDGLLVVKFQVQRPWIAGRLRALLIDVFRHPPLQFDAPGASFVGSATVFVTGTPAALARALSDPGVATYVRAHSNVAIEPAVIATDDWPYFYQKAPGIPLNVAVISLLLVVICVLMFGSVAGKVSQMRWHFLFLGAAFMLLEAQIISKMALLFGTTWAVNSIVIAVLLMFVLLANGVANRVHVPAMLSYGLLLVSLLLAWAIPMQRYFFASLPVRAAVATVALCVPVLFAGLIFIESFAADHFQSDALGSNLIGALIGGMLESLSLWTGLRVLVLVAIALYLASALTLPRIRTRT